MPSTFQEKRIQAPIDRVWQRFADFHELSWAGGVITHVEKVGGVPGDQVGAKRLLNGAFHETLTEYDPQNYRLRYSIDDGPHPVSAEDVSDYVGTVQLSSAGDGSETRVEWSSEWRSNSTAAVDFCHGIYVALLEELAASCS